MTKKKKRKSWRNKAESFPFGISREANLFFRSTVRWFSSLSLSLSLYSVSPYSNRCVFFFACRFPPFIYFSIWRAACHWRGTRVISFIVWFSHFFLKKNALSLFRLVDGPFRDVVNCRHFFCWRLCFVLFWCLNRPFRWLFRFPMALCFFLPSGFVLLLKFFSSKVLCYRNWSCYESEELFLIDV